MANHPESRHCPGCGSPDYITLHKERSAAFRLALVYNRQCADCGATYTPPTPRWLAIAAALVGGLTAVSGALVGFYLLEHAGIEETVVRRMLAGLFFALAAAGL